MFFANEKFDKLRFRRISNGGEIFVSQRNFLLARICRRQMFAMCEATA
jgi:hypothetical protein